MQAPQKDELEWAWKRLQALEKEIESLKNNNAPTVPRYDLTK